MIASIFSDLRGYLHTVFIDNISLVAIIGLIGQALFTARFLVQWLASERAGKSVIPVSFWFLSIGGGLMLLAYALYKQDPVFIVGQSLGTFIYLRNLTFIFRDRKKKMPRTNSAS